jgi:GH24 family phage-related lysozyme (muramidase)
MSLDPRLLQDLRFAESHGGVPNLVAYKDTKGLWTIGFGHKMADQTIDYSTCAPITAERAESFLETDVASAQLQAAQLGEWPHLDTPCRQNAVIELVFNMGLGDAEHGWKSFAHTRMALVEQDWKTAHDQLLASEWFTEVGAVRANRIANYLLNGVYPS